MKKKTNKNISQRDGKPKNLPKGLKNKKSTEGMASQKSSAVDKFKKPTLKVVKDSQVIYRSDKETAKTPLYTNAPIGKIEIIKDFLPAPEELILKDSTVKVTLNLSKSSIIFFKGLAEEHGSQYQKIIRIILDSYSSNYSK